MKKQFSNELININNLEQGKTGNTDLDNAISNVKEDPLIFSVEEANYLVENAMTNYVTSSVIKNTIIIGGAVLLSAVFGWMYYEFNYESTVNHSINSSSKNNSSFISSERNKIKLSSTNAEFSDANTLNAQSNESVSNSNNSENNIAGSELSSASNKAGLSANSITNSTASSITFKNQLPPPQKNEKQKYIRGSKKLIQIFLKQLLHSVILMMDLRK